LRKLDFGSKVVGMLVRAEVVIESLMTREIKVVLSCGMKKIRVKVNGTMMVLLKIQEITSWKMRSTRREEIAQVMKGMQGLEAGMNKDGVQGSSSRVAAGPQAGPGGKAEEEASLNVNIGKDPDPLFCHRCRSIGHLLKDCRQDRGLDGAERRVIVPGGPEKCLSEFFGPLCAIQVDGQAFPSEW
jgi:hypothetical protein